MDNRQISEIINKLSDDEDVRQDLWVHYLSGNLLSEFVPITTYSDDVSIREAAWTILQDTSGNLSQMMEGFSDLERSIIFCLMVGRTIPEISVYKGISEVRIRQIIATIRYNGTWKEVYGGSKEEPNRY